MPADHGRTIELGTSVELHTYEVGSSYLAPPVQYGTVCVRFRVASDAVEFLRSEQPSTNTLLRAPTSSGLELWLVRSSALHTLSPVTSSLSGVELLGAANRRRSQSRPIGILCFSRPKELEDPVLVRLCLARP